MNIPGKNRRVLGALLFSIGILFGFVFNGLAILGDLEGSAFWDDTEAVLFDRQEQTDAKLAGLKCPFLITAVDTSQAIATFKNPTERPISTMIRAYVSDGPTSQKEVITQKLALDPGETYALPLAVTPEDAEWEHIILVRVYLYQTYPFPSRTASCGILVVNWATISGSLITALLLSASLFSMVAGGGFWLTGNRPQREKTNNQAWGFAWLAGVVLVGILANLLGWWVFAGLSFVSALLLILGLGSSLIQSV